MTLKSVKHFLSTYMSKTGLSVQCVLFVSFFSYAHLIEVIMISSDEDDEAEQLEEREVTSTSGMFTKKKKNVGHAMTR